MSPDLELEGRIPWSSNATFLVACGPPAHRLQAIYKPARGERPLWDFPPGTLHLRETAAYVVSRALSWDLVPETVIRDGPFGLGAVQRFIPHDPEAHFLNLEHPDPFQVQRIVAFDVVINNADRKSGHVLLDERGRLWCIDHGVSFHVEPKLRTVIWHLAGTALPEELAADLSSLAESLSTNGKVAGQLAALLTPDEIAALAHRAARLANARAYPDVHPDERGIPWPPV
jgi:hypothetical protein